MDHLLGVGTGEFLEVGAFRLGEPMGQPEDLGQGVGFLLYGLAGRLVFLPHRDDHEGEQNGVDHAQGGVDESGDVVVGSSGVDGHGRCTNSSPASAARQTVPTTSTP